MSPRTTAGTSTSSIARTPGCTSSSSRAKRGELSRPKSKRHRRRLRKQRCARHGGRRAHDRVIKFSFEFSCAGAQNGSALTKGGPIEPSIGEISHHHKEG